MQGKRPIQDDIYSHYIYNKTKPVGNKRYAQTNKKFNNLIIIVISFIICIGLIWISIKFFSNNDPNASLPAQKLYCLQFNSFDTQEDANVSAQTLRSQGGAGYIVNDGTFHIIGAIYDNPTDINSVISRINDKTPVTSYAISSPKVNINLGESSSYKKEINDLLQFPTLVNIRCCIQ